MRKCFVFARKNLLMCLLVTGCARSFQAPPPLIGVHVALAWQNL